MGRGQRNAEAAEAAARAAFPATTVLHASWFIQEFSEGSLRDGVLGGVVALPVGDVPAPFVDVDDVADVAVAALTTEDHTGRSYEATGPEALTFAEAAAVVGAAAGRPVRLEIVGLEALEQARAICSSMSPTRREPLGDQEHESKEGAALTACADLDRATTVSGRPP